MKVQRTRTRLSPDKRREQLLETAKTLILERGLQSFTMEAVARTAEVSSPLVYNYFSSRQALLEQLLVREYEMFALDMEAALSQAKNFQEVVKISVTGNFDHHAPGNILPILLSQPEIASALSTVRKKHAKRNARFLVKSAAEAYNLTIEESQLLVSMSSGASIAAADWATTGGGANNRDKAITTAVQYILAGLEATVNQGKKR